MLKPLFRSEAIQHSNSSWLGKIRIQSSPKLTLISIMGIAVALALVIFFCGCQIARKVRISGVLVPVQGTLQLNAQGTGLIEEVLVKEDDHVTAGQPLFVLSSDRVTTEGAATFILSSNLWQRHNTLVEERSSRIQQNHQREESLRERIRSLNYEIEKSDREVSLVKQRVVLAQKNFKRFQQMVQDGFVSEFQVQSKQEELIDMEARVESLLRIPAALRREQKVLELEIAANRRQINIELLQLDRSLLVIKQELADSSARKNFVITATHSGVVTLIHQIKGSTIQTGQPVATMVPDSDPNHHDSFVLRAQFLVPSRSIGFIKPGQIVWMRYGAYPYQKFGLAQGRVQSISATPLLPSEPFNGQANPSQSVIAVKEQMFRIHVQLKDQVINAKGGSTFGLKPGMTLDADVIQDTRAVWEWVFEPLIAVRHQVKIL
jgi:membrane fusion protein